MSAAPSPSQSTPPFRARIQARARLLGGRDPFVDAYLLVAVSWCSAIGLGLIGGATDARGWYEFTLPDPYAQRNYASGYGFYFTPPIALALYPLTLLPWSWFAALWTGLMFAALLALAGRWAALAVWFPPVLWELQAANINLLIALAAVLATRWPAAWSFVLLTKITPGVAVLWHVVRKEWRAATSALMTTAIIVMPTLVLAQSLWLDWWASITSAIGSEGTSYFVVRIPLPVRMVFAAGLVIWGGRTDRTWTVPVAATMAVPVLWFNALAGLVGALAAGRRSRGGKARFQAESAAGVGTCANRC